MQDYATGYRKKLDEKMWDYKTQITGEKDLSQLLGTIELGLQDLWQWGPYCGTATYADAIKSDAAYRRGVLEKRKSVTGFAPLKKRRIERELRGIENAISRIEKVYEDASRRAKGY